MSLSQTLTRRRDADLLQRALEGDPDALQHPLVRDDLGELAGLLRVAEALPAPRVSPDPAFVATLRSRLVAEAERQPLPGVVDDRTLEVARTAATGPRTVRLPRGGRLLAGLATVAVLAAVLLGGLSTRALPGDALYPVKLMIGDAQVRLAGSDLGRGKALLSQVDARLDEVAALVAAGDPRPTLVDETLARASDDLGEAQRQLLHTGSGTPDPQALQVLADASAQATGRLAALRERVPVASVPAVDQLLQQLAQAQAAMTRQLDQLVRAGGCGAICDSVRTTLERQGTQLTRLLGGLATAAGGTTALDPRAGQVTGGSGDQESSGAGSTAGGGAVPTSAPQPSAQGSVSLPGVSLPGATVPGATVEGGSDGLSASVPGATVSLPGASVGLPTVGVTVPGISSGTLPTQLPGVTVGGATPTLGPVTIPVPAITLGGDCGLLCLGD